MRAVDWAKGPEAPLVGGEGPVVVPETQTAKVFSLDELEHATKKFSANNLIGEGGFGFVYKGLLEDGTMVAVKRRQGIASADFAMEVSETSDLSFLCPFEWLQCFFEEGFLFRWKYLFSGSFQILLNQESVVGSIYPRGC